MMPFVLNLHELTYYQPLIQAVQNFELIPAYVSKDCVNKHVTKIFDTKGDSDDVICTDFSAFDQHFGIGLQHSCETILRNLLGTNSAYWFKEVF